MENNPRNLNAVVARDTESALLCDRVFLRLPAATEILVVTVNEPRTVVRSMHVVVAVLTESVVWH